MFSIFIEPPVKIFAESEMALAITGIDEAPVPPKVDPNKNTLASPTVFCSLMALTNLYIWLFPLTTSFATASLISSIIA